MRKQANVVIIGAGIVGVSAAYHLTKLGWRDILVLDKGPLFETGGSTSHAPGLVFQTNASKMMCEFAQYTVELLKGLHTEQRPTFYQVGGIEVAYTKERWNDLHRRLGWAHSYGLGAEIINPEQVQQYIPILDPSVIEGGYVVPTDGVAKAVNAVEIMAEFTTRQGAAKYYGETTVTGFETSGRHVSAVVTDKGTIQTEHVLLATNIWGPVLSDQLGVRLPLMAVEHQYLITEPLEELAGKEREIVHPILRNQDFSVYFRQHKDAYGIGSYKHEPLLVDPHDVGKNAMRPFTARDFKLAQTAARELFPALQGKKYVTTFNGMFAFTIDGFPILGPAPGWDNYWTAVGVWVTHSGGVGKAIAEWMTEGETTSDLHEAEISRFHEYATSKYYVQRATAQQYREVYDIIHPMQQMEHTRNLRLAPYHQRMMDLRAQFFGSAGWERPQWYQSNARLLPQYSDRIPERKGWLARYWSPIQGAEHLATREAAALYDLSSFVKIEVSGPGAADYLDYLSANKVAREVGKVSYTSLLTDKGGIKADLTITRLAQDRFWVLTGGGSGMSDLEWLHRNTPVDGSVYVQDISSNYTSVGLWGPKAREVLEAVCEQDVSNQAFPYFTAQEITIETVPALALRISYVGELGWEIYTPSEYGLRLWDVLWEAGQAHGIIAAGLGAFDSLRLEKGYRALGTDIHVDYNPFEAGLDWAVRLDQEDFKGKAALLKIREAGISRKLCCLTLEEGMLLGKEPILKDGRAVGYVTSSNFAYSIGKQIAYGYLPMEHAGKGTLVEVEYFGKRLRATVTDDPLYDPKMEKIKA